MTSFQIPEIDEFAAMGSEERLKSVRPIADYWARKICRFSRVHLDEYASAGWIGLITICENFDRTAYRDTRHFRSICMRIARNAIIDEKRRIIGRFHRGKWRGLVTVDEIYLKTGREIDRDSGSFTDRLEEGLVDWRDTPAKALERTELPARAEALMSLLNPQQRRVMRLIYYDGKKKFEAAEILGVSSARIGQIVQASLVKLRSQ